MIRLATTSDLPRILEVYAVARQLMRESGNPNQWGDHFPPEDLLRSDIPKEQLWVVERDGVLLGKPRDEADAARMMYMLQGRTHTVASGIAVWHKGRTVTAHELTGVSFAPMTEAEIFSYVATGESFGKARIQKAIVDNLGYSADKLLRFTCESLREFTSREQEADITCLALKILSGKGEADGTA